MRVPLFSDFILEHTEQSHKDYKSYLKREKRLEMPFLLHPEGEDKIFKFVKSNLSRDMWMNDPKKLKNIGMSVQNKKD